MYFSLQKCVHSFESPLKERRQLISGNKQIQVRLIRRDLVRYQVTMFLIWQTEAYNSLYYWPHGKLYFIFKISLRKQRTLVKNKNLQYILFRVKSVIKLKFLSQVKTAISVIWPQIIGFCRYMFQDDCSVSHSGAFLSWNLMLLWETWITGRTHGG